MSRTLVALLSVVAFVACSDDAADRTSATEPAAATKLSVASTLPGDSAPTTVFSWGVDDLAEWVSEDEMTEALEDVLALHVGGDVDGQLVFEHVVEPAQSEDWNWSYRLTGDTEGWRIIAHDGDHGGTTEDMALMETDPRLPEGVVFEPGFGFAHGFYVLSGPNSDESICMTLFPPGASFGYPDQYTSEVGFHKDRVFALASVMLREMGWAS